MSNFIPPLALKTWLINVFAGSPDIFIAIAIMVIIGLSAYFRMNGVTMFFMLGIFLLMFSGILGISPLLAILGIIGGLLIGYWVSRIVK